MTNDDKSAPAGMGPGELSSDFSQLDDPDAPAHPAFAAFQAKMRGRLYGDEALNDAWAWFRSGFESAAPPAQPVTPHIAPSDLANALQDRIHPTSGRLISASPVLRDPAQPVREQGEADQQPPAVLPVETPPAEPSGNPGELPPRLRWDTWMVDGERFVLYVRERAGTIGPGGWRCFGGEWLADDCFVPVRARLISRAAPATPDTPPEDVPQSSPTAGPGQTLEELHHRELAAWAAFTDVRRAYERAKRGDNTAAPPPSTGEPVPIGGLEDALRCGRTWAESGSLHLSVPEQSAAVLARELDRLRAAAPPRKTPGELAREWLAWIDGAMTNSDAIAFLELAITADRGGR